MSNLSRAFIRIQEFVSIINTVGQINNLLMSNYFPLWFAIALYCGKHYIILVDLLQFNSWSKANLNDIIQ